MTSSITPVDKSIFNGTVFENTPFDLWITNSIGYTFSSEEKYHLYTPFSIIIFGLEPGLKDRTLIKTFSHDICHALDCFMRGKTDRLFQPEMGYGMPTVANWEIKMWKTEVRVLAMQYALLKPSFPCVKFYKGVALDLFTTRLGTYKKGYDETSYVEKVFKKTKKRFEELKTAYQEMCKFIEQNQDKRIKYEYIS